MATYKTARSDFEFLETLADLVDQVDLDAEREELMREPTKAHARNMYEDAISLWFKEHQDSFSETPRVRRIATRCGITI